MNANCRRPADFATWSSSRFLGFAAGWAFALSLPAGLVLFAGESPANLGVIQLNEDPGSLRDLLGRQRTLDEFDECRALVLCFLGTDCPLANRQMPKLLSLAKAYREPNVQFLAVYPHDHETLDCIAAHALDHDIPFPVLRDVGQHLANALGVTRTPTFCLLDRELAVCYRGRLNDEHTAGATRRARATREDLVAAIDDFLAGRDVLLPRTPTDGCLLDRSGKASVRPSGVANLSYEEHVAPLLSRRCGNCHRAERAAPFAIATYEDSVRWSAMIREVVVERRMPPWHADERYGHFANDRRLTPAEIELVVGWIDAGMPRTTGTQLARTQVANTGAGTSADDTDWQFDPDVIVSTTKSFDIPAEGIVDYVFCDALDHHTGALFAETRWVQAAEVRPTVSGVVHHVMVFSVDPGKKGPPVSMDGARIVALWAPGEPSFIFPQGTALRIAAGSRLVFNVHYTPNGRPATDRPRLALRFAEQPPEWEVAMRTHENMTFRIAPGDQHARGEFTFPIEQHADTRLIGLYPHMHVRGKSFTVESILPSGRSNMLLAVPRYDFNWQTMYWFNSPIQLPLGSALRAVAHWDNSRNNPANPDPSSEVTYGWQTSEEMMIAGMMFVFPCVDAAPQASRNHPIKTKTPSNVGRTTTSAVAPIPNATLHAR